MKRVICCSTWLPTKRSASKSVYRVRLLASYMHKVLRACGSATTAVEAHNLLFDEIYPSGRGTPLFLYQILTSGLERGVKSMTVFIVTLPILPNIHENPSLRSLTITHDCACYNAWLLALDMYELVELLPGVQWTNNYCNTL